jgi:hypothetical protein
VDSDNFATPNQLRSGRIARLTDNEPGAHKLSCPTCDDTVPEAPLENTSGCFAVAFDLTRRAIRWRGSASGTAVPNKSY